MGDNRSPDKNGDQIREAAKPADTTQKLAEKLPEYHAEATTLRHEENRANSEADSRRDRSKPSVVSEKLGHKAPCSKFELFDGTGAGSLSSTRPGSADTADSGAGTRAAQPETLPDGAGTLDSFSRPSELKAAGAPEASTATESLPEGGKRVTEWCPATGTRTITDYAASGLRTHQAQTIKDRQGKDTTSTTDYLYSNAEGGMATAPEQVQRAIAVQRDAGGRLLKSAQYISAAAVEGNQPAVEESVKHEQKGRTLVETHTLTSFADPEKPVVFGSIEKSQSADGTAVKSSVTRDGLTTDQEVRFDAHGRATAVSRVISDPSNRIPGHSYSFDVEGGKVIGVKLDGKALQEDQAQSLIKQAQESISLVAQQSDVRSLSDRARLDFLSPTATDAGRAQAIGELRELAKTSDDQEKGRLTALIGSYQALDSGLKLWTLSTDQLAPAAAGTGPQQAERQVTRAREAAAQITHLQELAKGSPPNERAMSLLKALSGAGGARVTDDADVMRRTNDLIKNLSSDDQALRREALVSIGSNIGRAVSRGMSDERLERISSGLRQSGSVRELTRDQMELSRECNGPDAQAAQRMLAYSEAMKPLAAFRETQPVAADVNFQTDEHGRLSSVAGDGYTARLAYKDNSSTEPASVELYDQHGKVIEQAEGSVSVNRATGEITVSRKQGDALSLAHSDVSFLPGGRVERNRYGDTGLRMSQDAIQFVDDKERKVTSATRTRATYQYGNEKGEPTDNPALVTSAVAIVSDAGGRPIAMQQFGSFAELEARLPAATHNIERSADGLTEKHTILRTADPSKPEVVQQFSLSSDPRNGARTLDEQSPTDNSSRKIVFDSSGKASEFSRRQGADSYVYKLNADGEVDGVEKLTNGSAVELSREDRDALIKEGNQRLQSARAEHGIVSYPDQLQRDFLERNASREQRQQALVFLHAFSANAGGAEKARLEQTARTLELLNQAQTAAEANRSVSGTNDPHQRNMAAMRAAVALRSLDTELARQQPAQIAGEIADMLPRNFKDPIGGLINSRHHRLQGLITDLGSEDPAVRDKALLTAGDALAPVADDAMNRARASHVKAGLTAHSSTEALASSQPALAAEAQCGNKHAENLLHWSEATRQLRLQEAKQPAVEGVQVAREESGPGKGRITEIKRDDYSARLKYDGDSKEPSSIELTVKRDGQSFTETIKPAGPVHFDERTGALSFSEAAGSPESLARTETRITATGKVEIKHYGDTGLRQSQQSHDTGSKVPALETRYTYIGGNGQPTENPLQASVVLAETTRKGAIVERNTFGSVIGLELDKPAMRETVQHSEEGTKHKEEHTFTSLIDPDHPQALGSSTRVEDSQTKEITVHTSLLQNGKRVEEQATFRGGEAVSYTRQIGDARLAYEFQRGQVKQVSVTNGEQLGLSGTPAEVQEALKKEGNFLVGQMQDQYGIDNPGNLESLRLTQPGSGERTDLFGTLVWKDAGTGGTYHYAEVKDGKVFQTIDGKKTEIGTVNDHGDVKLKGGLSFNVAETEGAALRGHTSDNVRVNLASKKESGEFTGVIRNASGDKAWSVVAGNVYDNNMTFVGHASADGSFFKPGVNGPSSTVTEFQNGHFEGTENGHRREWDLSAHVADGKMFVPDATGRPVACEVRFGMLINTKTQEQLGMVTAPKIAADNTLYDGDVRFLGQKEKVPLSHLGKAAFDLRVLNAGGASVYQDAVQGVCQGPPQLGADGKPRPGTGGYFSFAQAEAAALGNLRHARDELKTYEDQWNVGDRVTGCYTSNLETRQFTVRSDQRMWNLLEERKQAILSGNYNEDTLRGCDASLSVAQTIRARDDLSYKKQHLEQQNRTQTAFEELPADAKQINGSVSVPIWKEGKVERTETYRIDRGNLLDSSGRVVGTIRNEVDASGKVVQQGLLSMKDPGDRSKELHSMAELKGAVWNLKVNSPDGPQEFKWISAAGTEAGGAAPRAQLVSIADLTRQAHRELEYAQSANRVLGHSEKSAAAAREAYARDRAFEKRINGIASNGVKSAADLQYLVDGPKTHVTADAYKPKGDKQLRTLPRTELPADPREMAQVEGRLRMGKEVFIIQGGELRRQGESEPVGKLLPGYKVQFSNGNTVDLNTEAGTILQWKGPNGQTHNLVGLGAGTMTPGHGFMQGGLLDIRTVRAQAEEIRREAANGNKKYFEERPWITGGLGNWLMDDPEKVMKDLARTLERNERQIDETFALYFGKDQRYDPSHVPAAFDQSKFEITGMDNVGADSLKSRAGYVQLLLATMGSTATDLSSLSQQVLQVQHQIADSMETAAVTVGTAGAGAWIGALSKAGTISRGAAFLLNIEAGAGIGGMGSVLSMSDASHGFSHVSSGMVKGVAMATPAAFGSLGKAATAAGTTAEATQGVAKAGLLSRGAVTAGRSLLDSSYQTTMFASADWLKTGQTDQFSLQSLALGTGSMLLAQGVGHGVGHASDRVGDRVGRMIAGSESGQQLLAGKAGRLILGSELDQATGKASLWALKEGRQSLVAGISNQMGNAYSFGAVGAAGQAIEAEKARVAAQLGFVKPDGTPDADMVSTDSKHFSWSNVRTTMNQSGLDAMATAGPMAYGGHKINEAVIHHIETKAAARQQAASPPSLHGETAPPVKPAPSESPVVGRSAQAESASPGSPGRRRSSPEADPGSIGPQSRDTIPRRPGQHFADGVGGSLTNPDQPLRINAAKKAVADARLTAPLSDAMERYIDRGLRGIEVVQKALVLSEQARKAAGLDEAFLRGDPPDQIAARLRLTDLFASEPVTSVSISDGETHPLQAKAAAHQEVEARPDANARTGEAVPKDRSRSSEAGAGHEVPGTESIPRRPSLADVKEAELNDRAQAAITALKGSFQNAEEVKRYYEGHDLSARRAIAKELEWLADHAGDPRFNEEIISYPACRLRVSALAAGALEKFPDGEFAVFLHGTHGKFARETVAGEAGLTGTFFVSDSMKAAHGYSVKDTNKLDPAVIGIAVPRDMMPAVGEDLYLIDRDIYKASQVREKFGEGALLQAERIGTELQFSGDTLQALSERGFVYPVEINPSSALPGASEQTPAEVAAPRPKLTKAAKLKFLTDQGGLDEESARSFLTRHRECTNADQLEIAYIQDHLPPPPDNKTRSVAEENRELDRVRNRVAELRRTQGVSKDLPIIDAVATVQAAERNNESLAQAYHRIRDAATVQALQGVFAELSAELGDIHVPRDGSFSGDVRSALEWTVERLEQTARAGRAREAAARAREMLGKGKEMLARYKEDDPAAIREINEILGGRN